MCLRQSFFVTATVALFFVWPEPSMAQAAGQWRDGAQLYQQICQFCHDTGVGPALWNREQGQELDPQYIAMTTRQGRAGMPAFRFTDVDDATLAKLGDMIAKNQKPPATGGKP